MAAALISMCLARVGGDILSRLQLTAVLRGASKNIFGVAASEYAGNQKRKKGIWDSLLGDGGFLGGLLG